MKIIERLWEETLIYYRRYRGPHNKIMAKEALRLWFKAFKLIVFNARTKSSPETAKTKEKVMHHFKNQPEQFDHVKKATFAWFNLRVANAHFFEESHFEKDPQVCATEYRNDKCNWCGGTREEVRHDELPYYCEKAPDMIEHIKKTLHSEEEKALKLISRAEKEVPKIIDKMGMSGKTLMYMHETHGFVIEIVEALMYISEKDKAEYELEFEKKQNKSRIDRQIKKKVVTMVQLGTQNEDDEIWQKLRDGLITPKEAYTKATNKSRFEQFLPLENATM
jgi:hypothetical protein